MKTQDEVETEGEQRLQGSGWPRNGQFPPSFHALPRVRAEVEAPSLTQSFSSQRKPYSRRVKDPTRSRQANPECGTSEGRNDCFLEKKEGDLLWNKIHALRGVLYSSQCLSIQSS
jgi:hypothetical protein